MNTEFRVVRLIQLSILAAAAGLSAMAASAQNSERERADLEEAERQRDIARTFAANARQVMAFDMSGQSLGTIGEATRLTNSQPREFVNTPVWSADRYSSARGRSTDATCPTFPTARAESSTT